MKPLSGGLVPQAHPSQDLSSHPILGKNWFHLGKKRGWCIHPSFFLFHPTFRGMKPLSGGLAPQAHPSQDLSSHPTLGKNGFILEESGADAFILFFCFIL